MSTEHRPDGPFIVCENLVKIHKIDEIEVVALQGLDLTVDRGEMMAIIGPSGSGKSSLLNVLGGLDAPSAGKAIVSGVDLIRLSDSDRITYRRTMVGFVWQNVSRNLVPYLTALENVQLPMILDGKNNRERARELLRLVGLEKRMSHRPARMSGGEQQRVAVAIALANEPSVLLADEPTGSLDGENATRLLRVLDDVRKSLGVTVIIVTHDRSMARTVDRYVEIRDGKTSSEAVRISDELLSSGPSTGQATLDSLAAIADSGDTGDAEHGDGSARTESTEPASHDHYVLLDSAGRLQIPQEIRDTYGITRRVRLVDEGERIVIYAPDEKKNGKPK